MTETLNSTHFFQRVSVIHGETSAAASSTVTSGTAPATSGAKTCTSVRAATVTSGAVVSGKKPAITVTSGTAAAVTSGRVVAATTGSAARRDCRKTDSAPSSPRQTSIFDIPTTKDDPKKEKNTADMNRITEAKRFRLTANQDGKPAGVAASRKAALPPVSSSREKNSPTSRRHSSGQQRKLPVLSTVSEKDLFAESSDYDMEELDPDDGDEDTDPEDEEDSDPEDEDLPFLKRDAAFMHKSSFSVSGEREMDFAGEDPDHRWMDPAWLARR